MSRPCSTGWYKRLFPTSSATRPPRQPASPSPGATARSGSSSRMTEPASIRNRRRHDPTSGSRACWSGPTSSAAPSRSRPRLVPGPPSFWRCGVADHIRIALCDDHAVVRSGLRYILEAEVDLEVVGEAGSAAEAVEIATSTQPAVFVMDLRSEEHTSELQSIMRNSYAVFCWKKKKIMK